MSCVLGIVEIASTILVLRVLPFSLKLHRCGRTDLQVGEDSSQGKLNIIILNLKECGEKLGFEIQVESLDLLVHPRHHR